MFLSPGYSHLLLVHGLLIHHRVLLTHHGVLHHHVVLLVAILAFYSDDSDAAVDLLVDGGLRLSHEKRADVHCEDGQEEDNDHEDVVRADDKLVKVEILDLLAYFVVI